MNKQKQRVEIKPSGDGVIKLRYFDTPKSVSYFSWEMPIDEADDLARWWKNEGMQIRKRQPPVVEHKFGSVLISMFTHARVEVRGFDQYGRLKLLGYSLPRKVVECLSVWMQDGQHTPKLNSIDKEPK